MTLISRTMLRKRHVELGKIKIGGKGEERPSSAGGTFQLPVKYEHFVVTGLDRGKDNNLIRDEEAHKAIGSEKPKELAAFLMFHEVEDNFHSELCIYKGKKRIWTCDGVTATNLNSGVSAGCAKAAGNECKCKPYSRLHLQLADDDMLGFRVFRSTSWETANNLQTALEEIFSRFGTCLGAPVKLVMYPGQDTYTDGGKDKTSRSYKVALVLAMKMVEAAELMADNRRRIEASRDTLKLLAGEVHADLDEADKTEAGDIADEFFPDDSGVQASVESQERMDAMKADLGVSDEEEEVPVAEWVSEEIEPTPPPTHGEVKILRDLKAKVPEYAFTDGDFEAMELAVADKDGPAVRQWIINLGGALEQGELL